MRLIHVVPRLSPNVSGVGDYAVVLGRRLAEQTGGRVQPAYVQASFAASDQPPDATLGPTADLAGQTSPEAFAEAVTALTGEEEAGLLLHFVGYGYQQRGCPLWLVKGLRKLKRRRPWLRRLTMFHEVYARSYRPWQSSFWTMPVQRHVAVQVTRLSDGIMSNRTMWEAWLRKHACDTPVHISPTFSNVGEPDSLPPYEERAPYAVVFGSGSRRSRLYGNYGKALDRALRRLGIERIADIGTPLQEGATDDITLPIEKEGVLPAEEVSLHLQHASVGALQYSLHCITKSGILAGYAAHALPPLLAGGGEEESNTLCPNKHYLTLDEAGPHSKRKRISESIRALYDRAFSSRQAAHKVKSLLLPPPSPSGSNY